MPKLRLLSRPECGLCEEFQADLARLGRATPLPEIEVIDVDSAPHLARRHGLDIPVLLLDETVVCRHRFDADELLRLLRPR